MKAAFYPVLYCEYCDMPLTAYKEDSERFVQCENKDCAQDRIKYVLPKIKLIPKVLTRKNVIE